jgi:hypothetical protein
VSIAEQARRAAGCLDFAISADLLDPGPHQHLRALGVATRETFRSSGTDKEQRAAMLTVAAQEYIADVRPRVRRPHSMSCSSDRAINR